MWCKYVTTSPGFILCVQWIHNKYQNSIKIIQLNVYGKHEKKLKFNKYALNIMQFTSLIEPFIF